MFLVAVTAPDGGVRRELVQRQAMSIGGGAGDDIRVSTAAAAHVKVRLGAAYASLEVAAAIGVAGTTLTSGEHVIAMPVTFTIAGHTVTLRDLTPPLFEASYLPISAEEAALVDAIVTGDIASRMIYADWLEGRGDLERADIVRRLAEGGVLDGELLLALAPTNVRWRARVLEPAIEQCARTDCHRHWGALERTNRADLRRCDRCAKLALYCVSAGQAGEHRAAGGVVVYDPFAWRT